MRLFVAFEVPAHVRTAVERAVEPLRSELDGLRWTPPEQWHVTLAFIGSVDQPPGRVAERIAGPAAAAPATVRLTLGEPGRFGRRVLWLGVSDRPRGAVASLGGALQTALVDGGLPVDRKEIHPHLTLARARRRDGARIDARTVDAIPRIDGSWDAREIVLYDSVPRGRGLPNRHVAETRVPLG